MKVWKSPSNIHETIYPFYWILKIFGLVTFSFKSADENEKVSTTTFDIIYFIAIFLGHLTMLSLLIFRSFILATDSIMYQHGARFALFIHVLFMIILILFQLLKRKNVKKFLEILHDFDETVSTRNLVFHDQGHIAL